MNKFFHHLVVTGMAAPLLCFLNHRTRVMRLSHKRALVSDSPGCSLSGRHILSSHSTSDPVDICHTLRHTWIDKNMFLHRL